MNLTKKEEIIEILKKYGIRLTKGMGQNFLINNNVIEKVLRLSGIENSDIVVEIGPGIGVLTQEIAKHAKFVVAIEKDRLLSEISKENLKKFKNVEIINQDVLKIDIKKLFLELGIRGKKYSIIANLPYNISLRIIREFLEKDFFPESMTVIIQKEVGQKICDKKSNLPKIAFNFYGKPKNLFYISKESFWPKPKVDGSVLQIDGIQKNLPDIDRKMFFNILKIGFAHPRKTILNNLSSGFKINKEEILEILKTSKIDFKTRPENLEMKEWINLTSNFKL
jgi:16S rRNA (adenine1518-N6/adenine1519-N6)-dimethyltransferase